MSGIPTARSVDHVGISVPDLDQAIAFFVDVLGCQLLLRIGPFGDPEGDFMRTHQGVHPRATLEFAFVRCGPTQVVELMEYDAPGNRKEPPKNSDAGTAHLGFYVEDMDAAITYLRSQPGVEVLEGPTFNEEGPLKGEGYVLFTAPWGLPFELVSWSPGMPYEEDAPDRMLTPARSWAERPDAPPTS